jgi:glyoxylase I family protein
VVWTVREEIVRHLTVEVQEVRHTTASDVEASALIKGVHGIRYQTKDVARAVAFYTQRLGFTLKHQQLLAFAAIALGDAHVLLSGPGASGSRPMPGGHSQEPGGSNRIVLRVVDLSACIAALKKAGGVTLRNEMEVGPAGNPIELFEPAS